MNRAAATLAGIVFAACLLFAPGASAATLLGDYQLQGTLASSGPGPTLGGLNDVANFQTENVMGSTRQVDVFAQGVGLYMQPAGFGSNDPANSVVMTFRLLDDTGYNRILDWSAGTEDNGIYDHGRKVDYFRTGGQSVESSDTVFGSNTYSTLAVTMSPGASPLTRVFVNGTQALQSPHSETVIGGYVTFFADGSAGFTGEESAGAVSCIRVFSGILTSTEVAAIGASPDCKAHPAPQSPSPSPPSPSPSPSPAPKKCKKHKKHKRSAESAKKKCKKKRKKS
jgi:hypothetical protein